MLYSVCCVQLPCSCISNHSIVFILAVVSISIFFDSKASHGQYGEGSL